MALKKETENFVDYIPKHNALYEWRTNDQGLVEVKVHNKGIFNRIAQLLFRRPKYSYIELEGVGTFIWNQIDGVRNVYEIGQIVKAQYGEKAEPLYERLSTYVKSLHNMCFIVYVNKQNKEKEH